MTSIGKLISGHRPAPTAKGRGGSRRAAGKSVGSGAIAILVVCFGASAALRLTDPQGAFAEEAVAAVEGAAASPGASSHECPPTGSPDELIAAVREREEQLERRADEIADRARVLEVAEARYREQEAALREAEDKLAETLAIADSAAETDVARLVQVYEAMNPKNAAQVFESMDVVFAAGFVSRMNRDSAARIMSGLSPEKAYAVSAVIAGRNAAAPTQ